MNCGDPVSWLVPGLDGETSRVVYTRTTSPIQTVDRTDGTPVDCVTLACGRFVPVAELVAGHNVKPVKKEAKPKNEPKQETTPKASGRKVEGNRPAIPKATEKHDNGSNSGFCGGLLGDGREGRDGRTAGTLASVPDGLGTRLRSGGCRILAIDFLNLLVRAYHSGTKTETHAVRSMFQTVAAAIRELGPELVVFALDGGHDHRTKLLPQYKAHRPEPEPLLQSQKQIAEQAIAVAGFQSIRVAGFEADDVLASLARQNSGVVICSSDKDLLALNGKSKIYHPWSGGAFVNPEEKLGIPAGQVTDFLALCGDTSDGIPGVKGIGPKTALELLRKFGNLEAIIVASVTGQISGATGTKIKEQQADAIKCREVVELRDSLKLPDLQPWNPRTSWRTELQSMRLGSVEAIVSSLTPHLTNTPTEEREPVLSASPGQEEQNGREEIRKTVTEPPNLQPDQPSRVIEPEFRPLAQSVVPRDAAGSQSTALGLSGVSSGFVTRSISEPIRGKLNLIQKWDLADRGMIACWEAGREAAGAEIENPWRRGTPNFIAWQQGFQQCDLRCPIPSAEISNLKSQTSNTPALKPRHEPPARKKTGSLF